MRAVAERLGGRVKKTEAREFHDPETGDLITTVPARYHVYWQDRICGYGLTSDEAWHDALSRGVFPEWVSDLNAAWQLIENTLYRIGTDKLGCDGNPYVNITPDPRDETTRITTSDTCLPRAIVLAWLQMENER
jgi:hypothetical protein